MASRASIVPRFALAAAAVLLPPVVCAQGAEPAAAGAAVVAGYRVPDDWRELLRVDDAMRRYFAAHVPRLGDTRGQLDAIVAAILGADGLNFSYREDGNFDARETFRRRQGNCVAFSILVVAVAREYRLTARFNEVRTEPRWDRIGQVVAEIRHLNVVVRTDTGKVMVDLLPVSDYGVTESSAREVPDARAFAMFYSNNGVYLLGQARLLEALPLLERATVIAPSFALGWVNLGHAHSLLGDTAKAQTCYERALKEEPANLKALASLEQLYRSTGQIGRAEALDRKTERFRERNPYYLAALARRDLGAGDAVTAEKRLRRALAIKGDEQEFYELAITAAQRLGRAKDVERWMARLEKLRARSRGPGAAAPAPVQAGPAPAGP